MVPHRVVASLHCPVGISEDSGTGYARDVTTAVVADGRARRREARS
jgi:hypothetical protein